MPDSAEQWVCTPSGPPSRTAFEYYKKFSSPAFSTSCTTPPESSRCIFTMILHLRQSSSRVAIPPNTHQYPPIPCQYRLKSSTNTLPIPSSFAAMCSLSAHLAGLVAHERSPIRVPLLLLLSLISDSDVIVLRLTAGVAGILNG